MFVTRFGFQAGAIDHIKVDWIKISFVINKKFAFAFDGDIVAPVVIAKTACLLAKGAFWWILFKIVSGLYRHLAGVKLRYFVADKKSADYDACGQSD